MSAGQLRLQRDLPLVHELLTTRLRESLALFAALNLFIAGALFAGAIAQSEGLFTKAGPIIGGDFIVFRHAAQLAGGPDMASIYEMEELQRQLQAIYPGRGNFAFSWMYPPTMSLLLTPFAAPSYLWAYGLWVALFASLFFATLFHLWRDKWALFFIASSPAAYQAIITGQNGFLTASLFAVAAAFADRRPVIAGIAAGLLTIKPQLGLLIPIAFIAAGCWRAFIIAAVTAIALAAISVIAYGPGLWAAFIESVLAHSGRMNEYGFPFNKIVTPLAFSMMLGAPLGVASAIQTATSIAMAAYVAIVWRRVKEWDLRAASLITAALLATPYAFYYEFVIAAPALLLIAKRAVETGWLPWEKQLFIAAWLLPFIPAQPLDGPSFPAYPISAFIAFAIVARRALPAAGIRFASAGAALRADA